MPKWIGSFLKRSLEERRHRLEPGDICCFARTAQRRPQRHRNRRLSIGCPVAGSATDLSIERPPGARDNVSAVVVEYELICRLQLACSALEAFELVGAEIAFVLVFIVVQLGVDVPPHMLMKPGRSGLAPLGAGT